MSRFFRSTLLALTFPAVLVIASPPAAAHGDAMYFGYGGRGFDVDAGHGYRSRDIRRHQKRRWRGPTYHNRFYYPPHAAPRGYGYYRPAPRAYGYRSRSYYHGLPRRHVPRQFHAPRSRTYAGSAFYGRRHLRR